MLKPNISLTSYQSEALEFFSNKSGMLWHAVGSGKTLTTLQWWQQCPDQKLLYLTRAAARYTACAEIEKWTTAKYQVLTGENPYYRRVQVPSQRLVFERYRGPSPKTGKEVWLKRRVPSARTVWQEVELGFDKILDPDCQIYICTYEILDKWQPFLERLLPRPFSLVFSEIHRLKAWKRQPPTEHKPWGNLAWAAKRLSMAASRRLGETGTPIRDRPRDLWAELDLVYPGELGNSYEFMMRYTGATKNQWGGLDTSGSTNQEELRAKLDTRVHRVTSEEVLKHIPPVRRNTVRIQAQDLDQPDEKTQGYSRGSLADRAAYASSLKRSACVEFIEDLLDPDSMAGLGKILVFTYLRRDCELLAENLKSKLGPKVPVLWGHGDFPVESRRDLKNKFMDSSGPIVLIGTIGSFGECLLPNTRLSGSNTDLANIAVGEEIITAQGIAHTVAGKKTKMVDESVYTIHACGMLPITATGNHPILVGNGKKACRKRKRFNDFSGPLEWVRADALVPWIPNTKQPQRTVGNFVIIPRITGTQNFILNLAPFERPKGYRKGPQQLAVTPEVAWLLGLYAAEGSACSGGKKYSENWKCYFSLGTHEPELIEKTVNTLKSLGFSCSVHKLKRNAVNITCTSTALSKLLRSLFRGSSNTKVVPKEILYHADLKVVRAFLDGYIDGDGYCPDARCVSAATASIDLALGIQLLVARLGRLAKIGWYKPNKEKSFIEGREVKSLGAYQIRWTWERKRYDSYQVFDTYLAVPIKSIEKKHYQGEVVDISVDGPSPSFLASNMVVHNSLNLQDADHLILAGLPFTPGELDQAEGRVKRQGMKRPVTIHYLVAAGTFDELVANTLLSKLPAAEALAEVGASPGAGRSLEDAIGVNDAQVSEDLLAIVMASEND